jgi:hypothetical protein
LPEKNPNTQLDLGILNTLSAGHFMTEKVFPHTPFPKGMTEICMNCHKKKSTHKGINEFCDVDGIHNYGSNLGWGNKNQSNISMELCEEKPEELFRFRVCKHFWSVSRNTKTLAPDHWLPITHVHFVRATRSDMAH